MSKFDFSDVVVDIQESLKKNKTMAAHFGVGNSLVNISYDPEDSVVMPEWWKESFGVLGFQIGHIVQIAGNSDSGKTTTALEAIRRAQEQGFDGENKHYRGDIRRVKDLFG
jgi:hypothetical protein